MSPLYFLDQTRSDQDTRFYMAVLAAERTRNKLLEEERTRLHYHRFQAETEELRSRLRALERSEAAEREALHSGETMAATLQAQLEEAARRNQAELEAQEWRAQELASQLAATRSELGVTRSKLAVTRSELAARERRLASVLASTSWRITAPLRWTGKALRRGLSRLRLRPGTRLWKALRWVYRALRFRAAKSRLLAYSLDHGFLNPAPPPPRLAKGPESKVEQQAWPPSQPLVSVVIPSFNYGRYVSDAVASVLAQTFQDLEVIVVDGGSTEGESRQAARALAGPKTRVYLREGRHLVGDNRNFGIERASGKYICCLDADDLLKPTYLEKVLFLLETLGYDVVCTSIECFGAQTDTYSVERYPALADLVRANHVPTCAVFRRDLWERSGGFADTGTGAEYFFEDWRLWVRFAALGARFANLVDEPLFLYRVHRVSLSRGPDIPDMDRQREAMSELNRDVISDDAFQLSEARRDQRIQVVDPLLNLRARLQPAPGQGTILLAVPFLIVGGAERLLSQIVAHLCRRGYRVVIVSTVPTDPAFGDCTDWFEPSTREIYHLPRFLEPHLWRDFVHYLIETREVGALWIVGSAFLYDLLPEIRAAWPQIRTVDLLFNTVGHTRNNRKQRHHIDLSLVENAEVRDWLARQGEAAHRVRVIESGIDLETCRPVPKPEEVLAELGIPASAFVVGFSGRFAEEKCPETFLDVAAGLDDPRVHFLMTGAGPLADEVRRRVERLGMGSRLQFLGRVEDVKRYIAVYDALILPSRLDGRPVVVLESLAAGVPVIASRVGALPELVRHGETGFLCEPGDVEGFAEHVRWLAARPDEHRRMKAAARAFAERHLDVRRMLAAYEEVFRGLLGPDSG
jgi:glycosyltransferase involved in cell wall biosynthesis